MNWRILSRLSSRVFLEEKVVRPKPGGFGDENDISLNQIDAVGAHEPGNAENGKSMGAMNAITSAASGAPSL